MDFLADNAPVLRLEGLVIAFKDVQKGYWTFSKPYWTRFASFMRLSAWAALSAFCLVMEDISSNDEEVSSMEAPAPMPPRQAAGSKKRPGLQQKPPDLP
jgi:hypothetical protein